MDLVSTVGVKHRWRYCANEKLIVSTSKENSRKGNKKENFYKSSQLKILSEYLVY
jgi:hypothetical protein